jgi:rod shape determining protein RodA
MAVRVEHRHEPSAVAVEASRIIRNLDFVLLLAVCGLVAYGLWILQGVSRDDVPGQPDYLLIRQSVNVAIGVFAFFAVALLDPDTWRRIRRPLYAVALVVLAAVFVADQVRGTQRWIDIGFFQFQPSELGKVLVVLVLAAYLAERGRALEEWRTTLGALGLVAVPALLVFLEPDFGTTLVYGAILIAALFIAGTPWTHLAILTIIAATFAGLVLWALPSAGVQVLQPYQVDRLTAFLHPDRDIGGRNYNVDQSITAVGSGGLDGRGVEGATQTNMNYLPEHSTDFIFSALSEQRGFMGAGLLLLLYGLVAWRGLRTIAIAPTRFMAVLAGAIVFAFVFQVFVNVGMTIGIAPITGIPLPFVSYGGSSMIATLVAVGLLQAVHARGRLAQQR